MPIGTVKFFSHSKGFGFINDAGEADAFVHITAVEASGMHTLEQDSAFRTISRMASTANRLL